MKKTILGLTLILALLFSSVAGLLLIVSVSANPYLWGEFPWEPITAPPTINVDSPIRNQNYLSPEIWLNFTITKPDAWFKLTEQVAGNSILIFGNITSVYYIIDNGEGQIVPMKDITYIHSHNPQQTLNFSINLTLENGVHDVLVGLEADSHYQFMDSYLGLSHSSIKVNASSEIIRFAVVGDQESFPAALAVGASGASIAGVAVCLLYYHKKRNR